MNDVFAGEYQSVFKGRGIEFAEVREYQPGDEVRTIDWKVTARFGKPFVKRFVEERELTVILAVDASGSGCFGTAQQMKAEIATELCAAGLLRHRQQRQGGPAHLHRPRGKVPPTPKGPPARAQGHP